jgi:hypothetical protein
MKGSQTVKLATRCEPGLPEVIRNLFDDLSSLSDQTHLAAAYRYHTREMRQ